MGDIYEEWPAFSPCSWPVCERFGPCELSIACRRQRDRNAEEEGE